MVQVIINADEEWNIISYHDNDIKSKYRTFHTFEIGRIPFENIIDYDLEGDGFYNFPYVYVDFANNREIHPNPLSLSHAGSWRLAIFEDLLPLRQSQNREGNRGGSSPSTGTI